MPTKIKSMAIVSALAWDQAFACKSFDGVCALLAEQIANLDLEELEIFDSLLRTFITTGNAAPLFIWHLDHIEIVCGKKATRRMANFYARLSKAQRAEMSVYQDGDDFWRAIAATPPYIASFSQSTPNVQAGEKPLKLGEAQSIDAAIFSERFGQKLSLKQKRQLQEAITLVMTRDWLSLSRHVPGCAQQLDQEVWESLKCYLEKGGYTVRLGLAEGNQPGQVLIIPADSGVGLRLVDENLEAVEVERVENTFVILRAHKKASAIRLLGARISFDACKRTKVPK